MGAMPMRPTAVFPNRRFLQVLTDLPATENNKKAALEWAAMEARNGEEFLSALKVGSDRVRIIRRVAPFSEDEIFEIDR